MKHFHLSPERKQLLAKCLDGSFLQHGVKEHCRLGLERFDLEFSGAAGAFHTTLTSQKLTMFLLSLWEAIHSEGCMPLPSPWSLPAPTPPTSPQVVLSKSTTNFFLAAQLPPHQPVVNTEPAEMCSSSWAAEPQNCIKPNRQLNVRERNTSSPLPCQGQSHSTSSTAPLQDLPFGT